MKFIVLSINLNLSGPRGPWHIGLKTGSSRTHPASLMEHSIFLKTVLRYSYQFSYITSHKACYTNTLIQLLAVIFVYPFTLDPLLSRYKSMREVFISSYDSCSLSFMLVLIFTLCLANTVSISYTISKDLGNGLILRNKNFGNSS